MNNMEEVVEVDVPNGKTRRVTKREAIEKYDGYRLVPPEEQPGVAEAARALANTPAPDAPSSRHGANYRLSVSEKKRIFTQTGEHFEDHGQYKAWCKATGKRDIERGEPQDAVRRDMDGWYQDTGGTGEAPHSWGTAKGGRARAIPTPWREER